MRAWCIPARELGDELRSSWTAMVDQNPSLQSPYFWPDYTLVVARHRPATEVAVVEVDGRIAGFLPFERHGDVGLPVGAPMNDFQGLVALPDSSVDPVALAAACGLRSLRFNHLLVEQPFFRPFHRATDPSPFLDVSAGFPDWNASRPGAGRRPLARLRTLSRRLESRYGPLRFELHSPVFEQVLAWKRAQLLRTQGPEGDIFEAADNLALLKSLTQTRTQAFAGVVSGLWAGETLVSGHIGMRSRTTLHWWFPAFDPQYSHFSPGLLLLKMMIESAPAHDIRTIDLGRDQMTYKDRFKSGERFVAEAEVVVDEGTALDQRRRAGVERLEALDRQLGLLRGELEALRQSLSWRLTEPLRRVARHLPPWSSRSQH